MRNESWWITIVPYIDGPSLEEIGTISFSMGRILAALNLYPEWEPKNTCLHWSHQITIALGMLKSDKYKSILQKSYFKDDEAHQEFYFLIKFLEKLRAACEKHPNAFISWS